MSEPEMTTPDPGLTAAVQRVGEVLPFLCQNHLCIGCATNLARAAREDVDDLVREARAAELDSLGRDMESGEIGHKDDWGVEVIYTYNLVRRAATIREGRA